METTKVICDGCERDLTSRDLDTHRGLRLVLTGEHIAHPIGEAWPLSPLPVGIEMGERRHFCDLGCLRQWLGQPKTIYDPAAFQDVGTIEEQLNS